MKLPLLYTVSDENCISQLLNIENCTLYFCCNYYGSLELQIQLGNPLNWRSLYCLRLCESQYLKLSDYLPKLAQVSLGGTL